MPDIKIRDMQPEDWPRVAEIYRQGIETNLATFQTEVPTWEYWNENHHQDCRYVIEVDGVIMGWTALAPTSRREVYRGVVEVSLYLAPESWGLGLGTRLMEHLCEQSEAHGFWTLYSSTFDNNPASLRVQEKCGFRQVGFREKIAKDMDGNWRNTIILERRSKTIL